MRERISKPGTPNLNLYGKWRRLPPFPCASPEAAVVFLFSTVLFLAREPPHAMCGRETGRPTI